MDEWEPLGQGTARLLRERGVPAMAAARQMAGIIRALQDGVEVGEKAKDAMLNLHWRFLWYRPGPVGGQDAGWWER